MVKKPRKRTRSAPKEQTKLQKAIGFIKLAQKDAPDDRPYASHCRLSDGYAVSFNGILTIGVPIDEDIVACPHTHRLHDALTRCKGGISVVADQYSDTLTINSGRLSMEIDCVPASTVPYRQPDPVQGPIDQKLLDGFKALAPIVTTTDERVVCCSLIVKNMSTTATDGAVMVQHWHGNRLPAKPVLLPRQAVPVLSKVNSAPVGIGFSDRTVTFHFDDGTWVQSQLYVDDNIPDQIEGILANGDSRRAGDIHPELWEAIKGVIPASLSGTVICENGVVSSTGMSKTWKYTLDGLHNARFSGKHFLKLEGMVDQVDWSNDRAIYFFGDEYRAVLARGI